MKRRYLFGGATELRKAAGHRLDDARAAYTTTRWRACMYLAGYAVECRLKAALMKKYGCHTLRELAAVLVEKGLIEGDAALFSHPLERLLTLTGRKPAMTDNPTVWRHFGVVNRWMPA